MEGGSQHAPQHCSHTCPAHLAPSVLGYKVRVGKGHCPCRFFRALGRPHGTYSKVTGEPPGFRHPRSDPYRLSGSHIWPCSQKFAGPAHQLSFYHDNLPLFIDVLRSHCVSFPCLNSFHHHNPRTCTLIIPVLPVGKQAEQVPCHVPLTT